MQFEFSEATLRIDADVKKAGDFDRAGSLLEDALSKVGDDANDVGTRSTLLSLLADIQHLQGNDDIAADTHQQAISVAEELGRATRRARTITGRRGLLSIRTVPHASGTVWGSRETHPEGT